MKYAGVIAIPVYIAFSIAAYLHNPQITPLQYWMSDLGNYVLNPSGAWLYNLGCILTALLLANFYLGMHRWYRGSRPSTASSVSTSSPRSLPPTKTGS